MNNSKYYFLYWFVMLSFFYVYLGHQLLERVKFFYSFLGRKFERNWLLYYSLNMNLFIISTKNDDHYDDDMLHMNGFLSYHMDRCYEINCPCKQESFYDSKKQVTRKMNRKFLKSSLLMKVMIKKILDGLIGDDLQNADFYIYYSEFLFTKYRNVFISLYYQKLAQFCNPLSYQKFTIYMLRKKIMKHIQSSYRERIKKDNFVEKVIKVLDNFDQIKHIMFNVFDQSVTLWTKLFQIQDEEFKWIETQFHKIIEEKTKGVKQWEELGEYIHNSTNFILYYHWFQKDIWNQKVVLSEDEIDLLGEKTENISMKSMVFLEDNFLDKVIFREDFVCLHSNMEIGKQGTIKYITKNCSKLMGYTREELIGVKINKLMPDNISNLHDQLLYNYTNINQSFLYKNQINSMMIDKDGNGLPVLIMLKLISNISGTLEMVALIKLVGSQSEKNEYVTLDESGMIEAVTPGLCEVLGTDSQMIKRYGLNILMVAPDLRRDIISSVAMEDHENHMKKNDKSPFGHQANAGYTKGELINNKQGVSKNEHEENSDVGSEGEDFDDDDDDDETKRKINFRLKIPKEINKAIVDFYYMTIEKKIDMKFNMTQNELNTEKEKVSKDFNRIDTDKLSENLGKDIDPKDSKKDSKASGKVAGKGITKKKSFQEKQNMKSPTINVNKPLDTNYSTTIGVQQPNMLASGVNLFNSSQQILRGSVFSNNSDDAGDNTNQVGGNMGPHRISNALLFKPPDSQQKHGKAGKMPGSDNIKQHENESQIDPSKTKLDNNPLKKLLHDPSKKLLNLAVGDMLTNLAKIETTIHEDVESNIYKVKGIIQFKKIVNLSSYIIIKLTTIKFEKMGHGIFQNTINTMMKNQRLTNIMATAFAIDGDNQTLDQSAFMTSMKQSKNIIGELNTNLNRLRKHTAAHEGISKPKTTLAPFADNVADQQGSKNLHSRGSLNEKKNVMSRQNSVEKKDEAKTDKDFGIQKRLTNKSLGLQAHLLDTDNLNKDLRGFDKDDRLKVKDDNVEAKDPNALKSLPEELNDDKFFHKKRLINDEDTHYIFKTYIQSLFKKSTNQFAKEEGNLAVPKLTSVKNLTKRLKVLFFILMVLIVVQFIVVKWQQNYRWACDRIDDTYNLALHQYYSLAIYNNYLTEALIASSFYTNQNSTSLANYAALTRSNLTENLNSLHSTYSWTVIRDKLLYNKNDSINIEFSRNPYNSDINTYLIPHNTQLTMYFSEIYEYQNQGDDVSTFIQNNYLQNINTYIIEEIIVITEDFDSDFTFTQRTNMVTSITIQLLFSISCIFFYQLSRSLIPSVESIQDGFNYIPTEIVYKLIKYFQNLLNIWIDLDRQLILQNTKFNNASAISNKKTASNNINVNISKKKFEKSDKNNTQKQRRINVERSIKSKSLRAGIFLGALFQLCVLLFTFWTVLDIVQYNWMQYGTDIGSYLKNDIIAIMTSLVTMKQYQINSTFFAANQRQHLDYQTDLYLGNLKFEGKYRYLEDKINTTYFDRPCNLLNVILFP